MKNKVKIITIIMMFTIFLQMIFNIFTNKIDVTDKIVPVLDKSVFKQDLVEKLQKDKTFKIYIVETNDINKSWSYNKFTNTINLYLHKEFFKTMKDPWRLQVYLEYQVPVIIHEMIHYYLNDKQFRDLVFLELFTILDKEKDLDLSLNKNRTIISKRKHYLVKHYLKDKYTLEYVYSIEWRSNNKILTHFYEEVVTHYYMNSSNRWRYPEINKMFFK